jgi:ligand-binding sensor domain-containing protein/signal transduction histidine kinase
MFKRFNSPMRQHKRLRFLGAIAFLCAVASPTASARATASSPPAYAERIWRMQDGLPEQVVQAFAQTNDRYLWIGTTGGLLRFDGARFVQFDRENTPVFTDNNIFCLTVSRDNTLWIGSEGGGLIRYRNGQFRAFSAADGLTNNFVRAVYEDRRGQLWVGTDNGLFRLSGERFERIDDNAFLPLLAVHAIYEDSNGGIWVGGSKLVRILGSETREFQLQGKASETRVKTVIETSDHAIWVGTVSGLHRLDPKKFKTWKFERVQQVQGTVRFLRQTSDGTLWIGTIGHGLWLYRSGNFSRMAAPSWLPSNTVLNLLEDVEKNIWVGTQAGMLRLSNTPIRTVELPDSSDSDAETVYEDSDGGLWIAAANLFRFENGAAVPFHFPGVEGVRIRNVFRGRDGILWIGTEGRGVYRLAGRQLFHYTTESGLVNNFVRAFLQSRDGSIWIGTDEGVSRWHEGHFKNYGMREGLCYFSTRSLLEDNDGTIWIGTDRGISRLRGDQFRNDTLTAALRNEKVWAMHQDSDGGLWFGTRAGGLYRWRSGKLSHFTTADGLASNSIYELVEDQRGTLWISGPNGISEVSRRELDAAAEHSGSPITLTLYGISEGLEALQMCGGEKPAGLLTSKSEVWFPSSKGPVRISIDQPKPFDRAPVLIDQIVADGAQVPVTGQLSFSPDIAKLEIHYGVVLLRSQERVRFRYKLEGFDKTWSDPTADRVAHYTNLPAGQYTFRVAAFDMNNSESIAEASLTFRQRPHFYLTTWFMSVCVLILAAIAWSIHRFRLRQLRQRFAAVLKERNRLAREMHDTLIQGCVSVSALLEAHLSLGHGENETKQDLMSCARTQLRTTIDEAREAVWNLRQPASQVPSLAPALLKMTQDVSLEFGVPVDCNLSGRAFEFQQDTAHELLMVVREAIYNSVRHGHPSRIELEVTFRNGDCRVRISDDGTGFDPSNAGLPVTGHYGLLGMKERVERIGGKLNVTSRAGKGTEISFFVPQRAAQAADEVQIGL